MNLRSWRIVARWAEAGSCLSLLSAFLGGAAPAAVEPLNVGPYNDTFLEGGIGVVRPLDADSEIVRANGPWSLSGWLRAVRVQPGEVIVADVGDSARAGAWRGLYLSGGELCASVNAATVCSGFRVAPGRWTAVALTVDGGVARLYVDGSLRGSVDAPTMAAEARIELAPDAAPGKGHFGGSVASLTLASGAAPAAQVRALADDPPDFSLVTFTAVGVGWPLQEHAWRGLQVPQDPWTLPHAKAPPDKPVATPPPPAPATGIELGADGVATLADWHLAAAPQIAAGGEALSNVDYAEKGWYAAVVPGTVLTTLIARGVYPDPDYGLNNLAIPDTLSRQDYWYRSVFTAPVGWTGRELTLTFKGINYSAEVWLNGHRLGEIRGAFIRGNFDVARLVRPGARNALAVRISPPPHPGIPHEQSIAAGPGENGGALALDGPTFIATEGWDWIPGIRDRNIGLWQSVELRPSGVLRLRDAHVITHLPLPRIDSADILIEVPVENSSAAAVAAVVSASFDDVRVEKRVDVPPGSTTVRLTPSEFPQLKVQNPRLWWPNGYGDAALHALHLEVRAGGAASPGARSDSADLKFGIRELSYDLSLFDHEGRLERVTVDPTGGTLEGERLIDVRHEAIKRTPQGWAESLTTTGEHSASVTEVATEALTPYLTIRVNGVPIAARGGSWGMDDSRKRISRAKLEPYFRLHRAAHLNIIRNWLGQDTEDVFYDLADEYGLLILNDFWVSTQDFQLEPEDPQLFLANARDVISRYRNHPSIAVWFGRNEGVPQPIINEGLNDLVATLDGTRYYTGSSNSVNLQGSGPYNYRPPEAYFTGLARGFSVEVGTPSLSTLEALKASIPAADRWPLSDTYAYHDWHFGGNGDVATFMAALAQQYGAASSLEDFERKAQLMNYVSYRAIFEGFQAHLWTQNSGRLLWMTHPSWPSNTWQIYSSDYDTGGAYFAVKKACEPVHAQLNLPDHSLTVVNTTRAAQRGLTLETKVFSLDGRPLTSRTDRVSVDEDAITTLGPLVDFERVLSEQRLVLVRLTLTDAAGSVISHNDYWPSATPADQQRLTALAPQAVTLHARRAPVGGGAADDGATRVSITLRNTGQSAALSAKLTLLDARGGRALPVEYGDNYLTLLPGEEREVAVTCPRAVACARVALRGWNVTPREAVIAR